MTVTTDRTDPAPPAADPDTGHRASIIAGLRELADYIEAHPGLPLPSCVEATYCIPGEDDKSGEDEAYRIAEALGVRVTGEDGTAQASVSFGPVSYIARYISRGRMAEWNAHMATFPGRARRAERAQS
jgi:hypothetical protein